MSCKAFDIAISLFATYRYCHFSHSASNHVLTVHYFKYIGKKVFLMLALLPWAGACTPFCFGVAPHSRFE